MKHLLRALAALTAASLGLLTLAAPTHANPAPTVEVGTITSAPDNGTPPWARDDLTITTTINPTSTEGTYGIRQDITGTWTATGNPAINGTVTGYLEYTITGTLLANLSTVDDDVDLSDQAVKPSPSTVATWALRYFQPGAQTQPITAWQYTYATACEDPFTEPKDGSVGPETFTQVCTPPTTEPPATTAPPATEQPTPSPTTAAPTTPTTTTTPAAATLPVTGASVTGLAVIAAVLLLAGAALITATRRRADTDG